MLVAIVGTFATIMCAVAYLSSVQLHWSFRKAQKRVNEAGSYLTIFHWHLLNSFILGFLINDFATVSTSGIGLLSTIFYILTLLYYGIDPVLMESTLLILYTFAVCFFIFWHFFLSSTFQMIAIQLLTITSNVSCSLFLLQPIILSFKEKRSYNPKFFTYFNFVNAVLWVFYGYLISQVALWLPTTFSALMRFVQIIQILIYPSHHVNPPPQEDHGHEETTSQQIEEAVIDLSNFGIIKGVERAISCLSFHSENEYSVVSVVE
ncbi:hypothetical protein P9112_011229 [Eukaryota sp. TZLM1-RC]